MAIRRVCYPDTAGMTVYFAIYDPAANRYYRESQRDWVKASSSGKLKAATAITTWGTYTTYYTAWELNYVHSGDVRQFVIMTVKSDGTLLDARQTSIAEGDFVTKGTQVV